ncbi:MAG: hypothetical protein ABEK01_04400 [Candidatus Nanohaloarchaea archaeon]
MDLDTVRNILSRDQEEEVDEDKRLTLRLAGAAGAAALTEGTAGCATLDRAYAAHVKDQVQEDIEGLSPEETIDYFLREQRDFQDDHPYIRENSFETRISTEDGEYDVRTAVGSDIVFVDDCREINQEHVELEGADREKDYDSFTGEDMAECNGGVAFTDTAGDADYLVAEDRKDLVQGLERVLGTALSLQYEVLEGEGTSRPVARGQFIDVEDQQEEVPEEPGRYTVEITGQGGSIVAEVPASQMDAVYSELEDPWSGDYSEVNERTEIVRS